MESVDPTRTPPEKYYPREVLPFSLAQDTSSITLPHLTQTSASPFVRSYSVSPEDHVSISCKSRLIGMRDTYLFAHGV